MLGWFAIVKADILALEGFLAVAGPIEAKVFALLSGVVGVLARAVVAGVVAFAKSVWSSVFPAETKGN